MPDYKKVGATFMSLFRQITIPSDHDDDPVLYFDGADLLEDIGPLVWEKLELPEIRMLNSFLPFFLLTLCFFSTRRYLRIDDSVRKRSNVDHCKGGIVTFQVY